MKKKATRRSVVTTRPLQVSLTVSRFRDIFTAKGEGCDRATDYVMKLAVRDARATVRGGDVLVLYAPAQIQFTIVSPRTDKQRYYPVGITFVREGITSDTDQQRLGFQNFPESDWHANNQTFSINDTYIDDTIGRRFKFSLMIQRGSDGLIGIIDPTITHENDP